MQKQEEIIQIGEFSFKKRRIRVVLAYLRARYNFHLVGRVDESEELCTLLREHRDDILWIYEGEWLYQRCFRLLAIRPRSTKELTDFLQRRVLNTTVIPQILAKLSTFIDDRAFAEYLIDKERRHNPKGNTVIKMKLKEKGIDDEIITQMLDQGDQMEYIKMQYQKKETSLREKIVRKASKYPEQEFQKQMTQFLFSKGFSLSDIASFLRDRL